MTSRSFSDFERVARDTPRVGHPNSPFPSSKNDGSTRGIKQQEHLAPHSRIQKVRTEVPHTKDRTERASYRLIHILYPKHRNITLQHLYLPYSPHAMPLKASNSNTNASSPRCKCHNSQRRKMHHISFPACIYTNISTDSLSITLSLSVLTFKRHDIC